MNSSASTVEDAAEANGAIAIRPIHPSPRYNARLSHRGGVGWTAFEATPMAANPHTTERMGMPQPFPSNTRQNGV